MALNLGNVSGVVRSANAPLEADNSTVKKYVLWAKPIGSYDSTPQGDIAIGGEYDVRYYDYETDQWLSFKGSNNVAYGKFQRWKASGNTGAGTELNDLIAGWWTATRWIKGQYKNLTSDDDLFNIDNYVLFEDYDTTG